MDFNKLQQQVKDYDWRSLKKYTSPHAADDLNAFLEKLPQNAGQTMLIIAGIAWGAAGVVGLYTTVQLQKLTELRAELQEAEAIKRLTQAGLGASVLPRSVVAPEVRRGALQAIRVRSIRFQRTIGMVFRGEDSLSPPARVFLDMVKAKFPVIDMQ